MTVSYIDQSTTTPITGTNTSVVVPNTTTVGDLVLLFVFHRSVLTAPLGFNLVTTVQFNAQGATQYLSVFKLTAVTADISRSVSLIQSVSGRMSAIINVYRGTNGTPSVITVDNLSASDVNNGGVYPIPSLPAQASGQLAVAALSHIVTSSSYDVTPPIGFTKSYTTSVTDKRLFTAYKNLLFPDSATGSFTGVNETNQGYATCTIILDDTNEVNQPVRVTQAPILVVDTSNQPARVTQAPVLVLDTSPKRARVTQVPILVLSVPTYPVRVTQTPIIAPVSFKPIPLPGVFVPEMPVTETLEWYSTQTGTIEGYEQRAMLRPDPRITLGMTIACDDQRRRRDLQYMLQEYLKKPIVYPFYHYSAVVVNGATMGSSRIDVDTRYVNAFAGEQLAVFDPYLDATHYVEIAAVDANGFDLVSPLAFNVGKNWRVCATGEFITAPQAGLSMVQVTGTLSLNITTTRKPINNPYNTTTIETFDGMPIIPKRHLAGADELYTWSTRQLDNMISRVKQYTDIRNIRMSGKRDFVVNRYDELNKFLKFFDTIKGSCKPFLLPTYFDDIEVVTPPSNGGSVFRSSTMNYRDMWIGGRAWRTLRFETRNGVKYRNVADANIVYSLTGDAVAVDIRLSAPLGNTSADNDIQKISYAPVCRLVGDRVSLSHGAIDTSIQFEATAVNG